MGTTEILWMQGTASAPYSVPAAKDRLLFETLYDEGVVDGFKVVQRGAGTNMSVDVNVGKAVVSGDDAADQGNYVVRLRTSVTNVTLDTANPSNPRIDLVGLRVRDAAYLGGSASDCIPDKVTGTPNASPVAPATPNSFLVLAQVYVGAGVSQILDANITDYRRPTGPRAEPGTLKEYCGPVTRLPAGYLLCDGSEVSRTTYARLFDIISTTFGVGNGSTTFNLPDLGGRVIAGYKASDSDFNAVGKTGGEKTHTLSSTEMPVHNHGVNDPQHHHSYDLVGGSGVSPGVPQASAQFIGNITSNASTGITIQNAGSGGAHNNLQPYIALGKIIRT